MSATYQDLSFTTFPEQVQTFVTMLNMAVSDGASVAGYQQAMQQGDYNLAQQYFSQITNGNQKFVDATKMNTLMDTCVALQRLYSTDIEPYIEAKQAEWEDKVNQFTYAGVYSSSISYYKNNFVLATVDGVDQLFICLMDAPMATPVTNTTYWRQLTIRGEQGASGITLTFRYTWDSSETYYVNDVVSYNGNVWGCIIQNNNEPPTSSSPYWGLIYTAQQEIYPFSSSTPASNQIGSLWFELLT